MLSDQEKQILRAVRNFGPLFFDRRLGPSVEAILAAFRGIPLPLGKAALAKCDARQVAAIHRVVRDLSALVGSDWNTLEPQEREKALEVALGR